VTNTFAYSTNRPVVHGLAKALRTTAIKLFYFTFIVVVQAA